MIRFILIPAMLQFAASTATAEDGVRYFQRLTPDLEESVAIWTAGEIAGGMAFSGSQGTSSAYGSLTAVIRADGIIHATWNYEIEGSAQSEEQLLKIEGDKLFIGEGELEERGPGQLVLKDRDAVTFERVLEEVHMDELAPESEEAQPFMIPLKEITGKLAGAPVELEGGIRFSQGWVRFLGYLNAAEEAELTDTFADNRDNEFQIFIRQQPDGSWKLMRHGFRTEAGYFEMEEATEESVSPPWPLEEEIFQ